MKRDANCIARKHREMVKINMIHRTLSELEFRNKSVKGVCTRLRLARVIEKGLRWFAHIPPRDAASSNLNSVLRTIEPIASRLTRKCPATMLYFVIPFRNSIPSPISANLPLPHGASHAPPSPPPRLDRPRPHGQRHGRPAGGRRRLRQRLQPHARQGRAARGRRREARRSPGRSRGLRHRLHHRFDRGRS